MLLRYSKYRPTGFDRAGAFLPERQDWFVVPVVQTRDSGAFEQSNFESARAMLRDAGVEFGDDDASDAEIHRFGHWGPGWFEIIIVRPGSIAETTARAIEKRLDDYPILDEEHFSNLEWDRASTYWESMPLRERVSACQRFGLCIFGARHDTIPQDDNGSLFQYLAE